MHTKDCAIHDEGPCTCGWHEWLEEIARDETKEIENSIIYEEDFG